MLVETVVTLSAILGLLLSASVFIFHVITRKKEQREDLENVTVSVDKASDAAIVEINKTAQLALEELNEKYQALLFLYKLMDDKKLELENVPQKTSVLSSAASPNEPKNAQDERAILGLKGSEPAVPEPAPIPAFVQSEQKFSPPPKYVQIKELQEKGLTIKEIAKQLGLGKGEVELVINLGVQSSKQAVIPCK